MPHCVWWCLRRLACRIPDTGVVPGRGGRLPSAAARPLPRGPLWTCGTVGSHGQETAMVTTVGYKVIDLGFHDEDALASLKDILNHQVEEGWELVTSFQRSHQALQVGSTITPVPGLVSTIL